LQYWREAYPRAELWATSELPDPPSRVPADRYVRVDICDRRAVRNLVADCRPTHVIHLAGLIGRQSLADCLSVNVVGTENLYAALAEAPTAGEIRVVHASSAATYGLVRPDELPVAEGQLPRLGS